MKKRLIILPIVLLNIFILDIGWSDDVKTLKSRARSQRSNITTIESTIADLEAKTKAVAPKADEAEKIIAKLAGVKDEFRAIQLRLPSLEDDLERKARILQTYQIKFKPRSKVKAGRVFPVFKTSTGKVYKNAKVVSSGSEIRLAHDGGLSIVNISEIPQDLLVDSILAPTTPIRFELYPQEVMRNRPEESLSFEHRAKIGRKKTEEATQRAKLERMQRIQAADNARSAARAKAAGEKAIESERKAQASVIASQINDLRKQLLMVERERASGDASFASARIPNRGAQREFHKKMNEKQAAITAKILSLEKDQARIRLGR